jgi:hypothetical protein
MAIDRYQIVVLPTKYRKGGTLKSFSSLTLTSLIWLMSLILSVPRLLMLSVHDWRGSDFNCTELGTPHTNPLLRHGIDPYVYLRFREGYVFCVQYFIPLIIMSWCYAKVVISISRRELIGQHMVTIAKVEERQRQNRAMIKLLLTLVGVYFVTHTPFYLYQLVSVVLAPSSSISFCDDTNPILFYFMTLHLLQTACNPFINWWLHPTFRKHLKAKDLVFLACLPDRGPNLSHLITSIRRLSTRSSNATMESDTATERKNEGHVIVS